MNDKCKSTDGLFEYSPPKVRAKSAITPADELFNHINHIRSIASLDLWNAAHSMTIHPDDSLIDNSPIEFGRQMAQINREQNMAIQAIRSLVQELQSVNRELIHRNRRTKMETVQFLVSTDMIEFLNVDWKKLENARD